MTDVVIRGGLVVDGTGSPGHVADVAIADGRVVEVGRVRDSAAQTIDADGLVVAPGFIDVHTHYDAQLEWDATASPSLHHGVTTVLGGNCGFSLAPAGAADAAYLTQMMSKVEGIPYQALEEGVPWNWSSFGSWLDRFDGAISVNAGFLVGHSALRRVVMGDEATERAATDDEITQMEKLLSEGVEAGGLGFSTSQNPGHADKAGQPVPSRVATDEEFHRLAAVTGRYPGTMLQLVLAGSVSRFTDEEIALMISMSKIAKRPINWNVLNVDSRDSDAFEHQLRASMLAEQQDAEILALVRPNPQESWITFTEEDYRFGIYQRFPHWADVLSLPPPERIKALADPAVRVRLLEGAAEAAQGWAAAKYLSQWDRLEVAEVFSATNEPLVGRKIGDIATERGHSVFDTLMDVLVSDGLRTGFFFVMQADDDASWALRAQAWHHPYAVIGGSDAGAHLDMQCGANYTTQLFALGVRQRQLISLEEAVHFLSDRPAKLFGLTDRGQLRPGAWADVVLFEPESIGSGPMERRKDLPGGASRYYADAIGVERVFVNGVEAIVRGIPTGRRSGCVLRSGRDTFTVVPQKGGRIAL